MDWYGINSRMVELTSQTAVWYHTAKPLAPLCWVLVRNPNGALTLQVLPCAVKADGDLN